MGDEAALNGFDYGDAVAACCRTGGNARYCILHYKDLSPAPGNVDSAQAACIISTYMTAYQALHRCKPRGPKQTLEGVNILVTGANGPIGQAVIELAHRAGASKIFATAAKKYHAKLNDLGVCPLPLDAALWLPLLEGKMDIVIDGICQDAYKSPRAALNKNGHLIVIGMTLLMNTAQTQICGTPLDIALARFKAGWLMSNTTRYCPYESSQKRPAEWKVRIILFRFLFCKLTLSSKIINFDFVFSTIWNICSHFLLGERSNLKFINVCLLMLFQTFKNSWKMGN